MHVTNRWFDSAAVVLLVPGVLGRRTLQDYWMCMASEISKIPEAFASLQNEHHFLLPGDVYSSIIFATSTRSHKKCTYETNIAASTCPIIHNRVQDGATPQF